MVQVLVAWDRVDMIASAVPLPEVECINHVFVKTMPPMYEYLWNVICKVVGICFGK